MKTIISEMIQARYPLMSGALCTRWRLLILAALCVLSMLTPASAMIYHVAPNGDDSNPGSVAEPLKTPKKAVSIAAAGDVIKLHAGTYRIAAPSKSMLNFAHSGTAEAPIIMEGAGDGEAVLSGMLDYSDPTLWTRHSNNVYSTAGIGASRFDGDVHVVVQYDQALEPKASLAKLTRSGTFFYDKNNKKLYVWALGGQNPGKSSIQVSQCDAVLRFDAMDRYIVIQNLTITGGYYGIQCLPNGGNRTFKKIKLKHFKNDAIKFNTTGNHHDLIENCIFSSFGDFGIDTYGSWEQTIRNNEFKEVHSWKSGGAIKSLAGGSSHLIEGNFIHDLGGLGWEGAIELREAKYIRVVNNVISRVRGEGINVYGNNASLATPVENPISVGVEIVNNTIHQAKNSGIRLMQASRDTAIHNNIIVQSEKDAPCLLIAPGAEAGLVSDHNDFFHPAKKAVKWLGTIYQLPTYQALTGKDKHSLSTDPLFQDASRDDFCLQDGSPALDRGDVSIAPGTDMHGTKRPQGAGLEMGACERPGSDSSSESKAHELKNVFPCCNCAHSF